MRLHHLTEARKPAPPAPVDLPALLARITALATRLAHHPFDFDWDFHYGNVVKMRVEQVVKSHNRYADDEDFQPLDERDLWIENLPVVYGNLALMTFGTVKTDVSHMEREYQARHAERMADEAGHSDPMHYVESSDWLSAMTLQARTADALSLMTMRNAREIEAVVAMLEAFATDWTAARQTDDEPILTEGMTAGLSAIIPLMAIVVKKSV